VVIASALELNRDRLRRAVDALRASAARSAALGGRARVGAEWPASALARTEIASPARAIQLPLHSVGVDFMSLSGVTRVAPLLARVDADAQFGALSGAASSGVRNAPWFSRTAARRVRSWVWLEPPRLPLHAALTALSVVDRTVATVSGTQTAGRDSECDDERSAGHAARRIADVRDFSAVADSGERQSASRELDVGLAELLRRAARAGALHWHTTDSLQRSPSDSLTPWQVHVVQAIDTTQRRGAGGVTVTPVTLRSGQSTVPIRVTRAIHVEGLLIIDGDVVLHAPVVVRGLVVVLGALTLTGGSLTVHGALLIAPPEGNGALRASVLSATSAVHYAPCLLARALTVVARPTLAPTHVHVVF
jgi:hypothetical protein